MPLLPLPERWNNAFATQGELWELGAWAGSAPRTTKWGRKPCPPRTASSRFMNALTCVADQLERAHDRHEPLFGLARKRRRRRRRCRRPQYAHPLPPSLPLQAALLLLALVAAAQLAAAARLFDHKHPLKRELPGRRRGKDGKMVRPFALFAAAHHLCAPCCRLALPPRTPSVALIHPSSSRLPPSRLQCPLPSSPSPKTPPLPPLPR